MWHKIENDAQWKELRSKNVGGSEVGSLFGVGYLSRFELWHMKNGTLSSDIEDNDRMFWGRKIEDAIAQGVREKTGFSVENANAYVTCDDTPGMGCTPDRVLIDPMRPENPGLLQIKNTDYFEFKKWGEGEPPMKFTLQLQHELACTGYTWGILAVLVGGNQLEMYNFSAHEGAIKKIKNEILSFWLSIDRNEEPMVGEGDFEAVKDVYRTVTPKIIDLSEDPEIKTLCKKASKATALRIKLEKLEKSTKARILQLVGDAEFSVCEGWEIKRNLVNRKGFVVSPSNYVTLDLKKIK